ncbi:MAG: alpha-galactosidase [Parasphingorhabdus sp.]
MTDAIPLIRLDGDHVSLVFSRACENIDLIYLGPTLLDDQKLQDLEASQQYGQHENQPDHPPITGIFPQTRGGYGGPPALEIVQSNRVIDPDFRLEGFGGSDRHARFTWADESTGLLVDQHWEIGSGDVVRVATQLAANKTGATVMKASSLVLPLASRFDRVTWFPGRWAKEAQETKLTIDRHIIDMSTHAGKPGFAGGNWIMMSDSGQGDQVGIHTSSLGNHNVQVFRDFDGRAVAKMAAHCPAGGIFLADRGSAELGVIEFCYAPDADIMTHRFQDHVRNEILPDRSNWGLRKVHLNSWEALSFDLSERGLMQLANDAAELGVERLVLDDGWFKNRRNDRAALGDWTVDAAIFSNGLIPLIDHVKSHGMDFGLWVEPEMISPNSDLYRAHPDWCLHDQSDDRPTERNQLVLDLNRDEVRQYIKDVLDSLLRENDVSYLKWDHNRRLFPDNGKQEDGIRDLLVHMHKKWPDVEIEICSSGGGRISTAYLRHCHRVWPSDNNDPIERLPIMQSWSRFLPLEVLGNHVGPSPNPITGRRTAMDFRAKVAMFGHMGVEADPADMSDADRDCLAAHIALFKKWRSVLHSGDYARLDHPDDGIFAHMVVRDDAAIGMAAQTGFAGNFNAAPVRLKGLEPDAQYLVQLPKPWPIKASQYLPDAERWEDGLHLTGQALMRQGLALPLIHSETAWLFTLQRIDS